MRPLHCQTRILATIIFFHLICSLSGDEDSDLAAYNRIGKFLARKKAARTMNTEELKWLTNSNKIALGYRPTNGDPRCFDGDCVMNGFMQPIFELDYTKVQQGSCTDKLIPAFVTLNCISSVDQESKTEEISDFRQLSESLGRGASWQVGLGAASDSAADAMPDGQPTGRVGPAAAALWGMVGTVGMAGLGKGPLGAIMGLARPSAALGRRTGPGGSGLGSGLKTMAALSSFGMSFGGSSQTRSIVNDLYKEDSSVFFTTAKVTTAKLSLYEPRTSLSSEFREVIENMPCCDYSSDVQRKYVYDYVLNYFGTTFLTSILLGGVAQQKITIKNSVYQPMRENDKQTASNFGLSFASAFKFGTDSNSDSNNSRLNEFRKSISTSKTTTLGGAIFGSEDKLNDWFPTVEQNPVIVSFTLQPIFDLLTNDPRRFPNDTQIDEKADFIAYVLESMLNQTEISCENGCTDPSQGTCEYAGFFMYGFCNCNLPWTGIDCSYEDLNATTPVPPPWRRRTTVTTTGATAPTTGTTTAPTTGTTTTRRWFG